MGAAVVAAANASMDVQNNVKEKKKAKKRKLEKENGAETKIDWAQEVDQVLPLNSDSATKKKKKKVSKEEAEEACKSQGCSRRGGLHQCHQWCHKMCRQQRCDERRLDVDQERKEENERRGGCSCCSSQREYGCAKQCEGEEEGKEKKAGKRKWSGDEN